MSTYQIEQQTISPDDPGFLSTLARAHGGHVRPLCLCRSPGVDMYVAKIGQQYIVKRMPNTGKLHNMHCDSYEPPEELSGLGQVDGSAIQEDTKTGETTLKFNFPLTKAAGKKAPKPSETPADTVKTDGMKLTLTSTLHYLWEQAGFNRYTPAMAGKRSWSVIRTYLQQAASGKLAKGQSLANMLYIPETFVLDRKDDIAHRRRVIMNPLAADTGTRKLMIVVGEVKEIGPSRYGYKVVFKHLADCHFMMNEDLQKRLQKRFEAQLQLWDALEQTHLVLIGTFSVSRAGVPSLEELALVNMTENWIPFENTFEYQLLQTLTSKNRSFIKGVRYNLPANKPIAAAVLSDTGEQPTALLLANDADDNQAEQLEELITGSNLATWRWSIGDVMPALPVSASS